MINQPQIYHGGALDQAIAEFGGDANNWLDLSTGINPYHYPTDRVSSLSWAQLPQKSALNMLLTAASAAYNCPKKQIFAANGTQYLIETLPQILPKSTIAILAPTYQEHAHNWQKHGHKVILVDDIEQAKQADHLIIVNPNNPTGKLFTPQQLQVLQKHFAAKGGYLIIDEAFMDMTPDMSMAAHAGQVGLIILRSFGKFFGLAGVRVGFILADDQILHKIEQHIGLWSISGMAIDVAENALNDHKWQRDMRQTLAEDMRNMCQILQLNKFDVIGQTDLFCLVKMPDGAASAHEYFTKLAQQHTLTRKFIDDATILRFGLAKRQQQSDFAAKLNRICEVQTP
ncbi:MAG: threonine-phosphate decarboxylase [Alphaproteobacteria bacterium]|nr:threonine-phosphate decarboxylase [Alphaproteobacteria bacterium]